MKGVVQTEVARALELIEAVAWAQIQRAVVPTFRDRFGVSVRDAEGVVKLLAPLSLQLALNRVFALGVATPLTVERLDALIAEYRAANVTRFVVGWAPVALPDDARQWFIDRGFRTIRSMAKTCRPTESTIVAETGLQVVEIDPVDADRFGTTAAQGNDLPPEFAPGFNSTIARAGWHHYLALDGVRPVSAAAMYVEGDFAWGGLAGTIASDRGRGAQSALLARRIRDAHRLGARWITCEATADSPRQPSQSLRNMRRLGFEVLYERENYVLDLAPSPIA